MPYDINANVFKHYPGSSWKKYTKMKNNQFEKLLVVAIVGRL